MDERRKDLLFRQWCHLLKQWCHSRKSLTTKGTKVRQGNARRHAFVVLHPSWWFMMLGCITLCGTALFEVFDFLFALVLDVVDGLADFVARLIGLFLIGVLLRVGDLLRRVFGVAPSLFGCTFSLVDESFVGQFLVAYGFSNALFYFSNCLVKFSGCLILVPITFAP